MPCLTSWARFAWPVCRCSGGMAASWRRSPPGSSPSPGYPALSRIPPPSPNDFGRPDARLLGRRHRDLVRAGEGKVAVPRSVEGIVVRVVDASAAEIEDGAV